MREAENGETDSKGNLKGRGVRECWSAQVIRDMEDEKNGLNEMEVAYAMSTPFGAGIETVSFRMCPTNS